VSLDLSFMQTQPMCVAENNITHNLTAMADLAGVYTALWHPERLSSQLASDIRPILEAGLAALLADPPKFQALNPENGWGSYSGLVEFVRWAISQCLKYPNATLESCT
jgi:hypothetical protein